MKLILIIIITMGWLSNIHGQMVDQNTALKVASNYFSQTTGRLNVTMVVGEISNNRNHSPLYFICNSSDGKGYVIVAGTMASTPILAYSPEHIFQMTESTPEVIKFWMREYEEQLTEIIDKRLAPTSIITEKWDSLIKGTYKFRRSGSQIGPLLKTLWGQNFNSFCPSNAPAGCIATAMAQIMRYWSFPVSGSTYVIDVDSDASDGISGIFSDWVGGDYYDWNNMPETGSLTSTQVTEISELMYHCGIGAQMNYGLSGSGTFEDDAQYALKNYFGYSSCYVDQRDPIFDGPWADKIRDELSAGRPVLYCGADMDQDTPVAHAWVCDGYDGDLYHMNWGWGEGWNDYYSLDGNFHLDDSHYDDNQCAILGIEPPGCVASYEGEIPTLLDLPISIVASDFIYFTGGTIESGIAIYNAGNKIVLEPGCSILEGTFVDFYIEGCTGEPFQGDDEIEVRSTEMSSPDIIDGINEGLIIAPNPFSYSTNFNYKLSNRHEVSIAVHNSAGTVVATLFEKQYQNAGEYNYTFEAFDLPAGLYVVVLQKDGERIAKRMVLSK